jgi:zinc transport system permease protein
MSHKGDVREDSAIALFWTFGMSIGIIFCFLTPGFMPDMPSFLFGSILAVGPQDIALLLTVTCLVVAFFLMFYHSIVSVAFDSVFARSQHLHVDLIEYIMMILIAMTIVSTLRLVGIVLAISLLTVPQMTANLMTFNFKKMIFISILLGWIDCILGLFVSYWLNVPSGASIIFSGILVYLVVKISVTIRNKHLQRAVA